MMPPPVCGADSVWEDMQALHVNIKEIKLSTRCGTSKVRNEQAALVKGGMGFKDLRLPALVRGRMGCLGGHVGSAYQHIREINLSMRCGS